MSAPTTAWLAEQRWFRAMSSRADDVQPTMASTRIGPDLVVTIVDTGEERYQLVGSDRDDPRPDTLDDPRTGAALTELVLDEAEVPGGSGLVRGRLAAGPAVEITDPSEVRLLSGEQSNSSIVVDESLLLKVFRRLQAGVHPELELLRVLSERGFPNSPHLAGWYELVDGSEVTTLGLAQTFVRDGRDGWVLVLAGLSEGRGGELLAPLHDFGRVLASLHRVLGSASDVDGFAPTPGGKAMPAEITASLVADAERVLPALAGREGCDDLATRAFDVSQHAHALADRLDGGPMIRHHGDLHLGQALLGPDGWVILDFEGEPARSLAERRRPRSPLRDVAGMLRSFAYAAATHSRMTGAVLPTGWEAAARAAFLDGYLGAADPELLPPSAADSARLLRLLELEKVVYELRYELEHRPDWISIPAAGLRRALWSSSSPPAPARP